MGQISGYLLIGAQRANPPNALSIVRNPECYKIQCFENSIYFRPRVRVRKHLLYWILQKRANLIN
jgi:hypothetical protein